MLRKLSLGFALLFVLSFQVQAETTVTAKGLHMCCRGCVKTINGVLAKVDGADAKVNRKAKTVTIKAKDDATAQKAIDALAAAGFHGKTNSEKIQFKDDSGAGKGKVKRVVVAGAHNCCPLCCKELIKICKGVTGVEGTNVKPKVKSFVVEGNFSAAELIKALNAAGFHAKIKK